VLQLIERLAPGVDGLRLIAPPDGGVYRNKVLSPLQIGFAKRHTLGCLEMLMLDRGCSHITKLHFISRKSVLSCTVQCSGLLVFGDRTCKHSSICCRFVGQ